MKCLRLINNSRILVTLFVGKYKKVKIPSGKINTYGGNFTKKNFTKTLYERLKNRSKKMLEKEIKW